MCFLKAKSDTVRATEKFIADVEPYGKIKCIRCDNGTEFTSKEFQSLISKNAIRHETSAPYSPHQNGTAERKWRRLFEMARCMLIESKLPKELWTYAVQTAAAVCNRCYSKRTGQTPYYMLTGKVPGLSRMKCSPSVCYAHKYKKKKLDSQSERGVFVGYHKNSPAYLIFYPETGRVLKNRLVKFISKCVNECQTQTDQDRSEYILYRERAESTFPKIDAVKPITQELKAEICDTDVTTGEGQSVKNARYPKRERRPPKY